MVPAHPPISTIFLPIPPTPHPTIIACITAANGGDDGQIGALLHLLKYFELKMNTRGGLYLVFQQTSENKTLI